ncbi:MAG: phosphodiesterase YaeI [Acidobacteria bacterium]|nr:phosphodiesterase YaeI [Acidobacteriota bacterium]
MNRRRLVQLLGGGVVAASYPTLIEPRWLKVQRETVALQRVRLPHPVRVLLLSDLHRSNVVPYSMIEAAIDLGLAQKPDLICLTGDFITRGVEVDLAPYSAVLRRLSSAAPTYAVLGNHDGGHWAGARRGFTEHSVMDRILEDSAVHLLHNRSMTAQVRDSRLQFVGVADLWSLETDADRAFSGVDVGSPVILLSHNPDSKEILARRPWDLMLSGHTHGGQVILPLVGPRYAPVADMRFVAGLGEWNSRWIYVTRGVGNVGSVRLRCRPEVNILEVS